MDDPIQEVVDAILHGNAGPTEERVRAALASKLPASTVLRQGMIAAMAEVGELFERGEYFVPEMLVAARAMQQGLSVLKPHLQEGVAEAQGTVVIGTVEGDPHDIGKNLVGMMLEGAGFRVVDLGVDVPAARLVEAARGNRADVVAMSALLTTTMPQMRAVIGGLEEAGLRDGVRVIVGGAPVTEQYAAEIGADGYAADAGSAAKLTRSMLD